MADFPWGLVITVFALGVSLFAFLWEFVFVGRKRLGHRVQMDTTVANMIDPKFSGDLLPKLIENDRSFVLVRIENNGRTPIGNSDYAVMPDNPVGIEVRFPGRRVIGMALTDLTPPDLDLSLRGRGAKTADGLGSRNVDDMGQTVGIVDLPRVTLNRGDHYKVLVALESANGDRGLYPPPPPPQVVGAISGGTFKATKNRTGTSKRSVALATFLSAAIIAQQAYSMVTSNAPLDCAHGELTITGSTAFAPILGEAITSYRKTCPDASFVVKLNNSNAGLELLNTDPKNADMLAFSDGPKPDGYPKLLPRPVALLLFTLVIHPDAGVQDLTTEQIKDLYSGKIANWRQVGGKDQPVRLISRTTGSGTRQALERHVLGFWEKPATNSIDCKTVGSGAENVVVRCEKGSTQELLDAVASTPGAIGYSELGLATAAKDIVSVRINGFETTIENVNRKLYPFWQTENAYTFATPKADALTASFLRYLTNQVGQDIIRASGDRPCSEMENPLSCQPV